MHNAKTVLPGAEVPLVVKFADARKKDGFANGLKRGLLADPWADKRQLGGGVPEAFLQVTSHPVQHCFVACSALLYVLPAAAYALCSTLAVTSSHKSASSKCIGFLDDGSFCLIPCPCGCVWPLVMCLMSNVHLR